jgi:hypothetical protein
MPAAPSDSYLDPSVDQPIRRRCVGAFPRNSGRQHFRKFLQEGQTVRFDLTKGPKGWQAENVQAV